VGLAVGAGVAFEAGVDVELALDGVVELEPVVDLERSRRCRRQETQPDTYSLLFCWESV
jgi:hypothetical protein